MSSAQNKKAERAAEAPAGDRRPVSAVRQHGAASGVLLGFLASARGEADCLLSACRLGRRAVSGAAST